MTEQPPERTRLRQHIEQRREELGETWAEIADRAGLPDETIRRIRTRSSPIRLQTRHALERGLRWNPGSINAVLAGGHPTPEEAGPQVSARRVDATGVALHVDIHAPAIGHRQVMIPLDLAGFPRLAGLDLEEQDTLVHQLTGVMMHAAEQFLQAEDRRRAGPAG